MWNDYIVKIQHTFGHRMNVWITTLDNTLIKSYMNINNFGTCDNSPMYYIIQDVGSGSETLELSVYDMKKPTHPVWTKKPVGPDAAYKDDKIYYQSVENQLRYPGILCADKNTGEKERELFHESDKRFQVELHKPAHQDDIFIRVVNALQQRLGKIVGNTDRIRWLARKSQTLYPICSSIYASNTGIHNGSRKYAYPKGFLVNALGNEERIYVTTVQKGYTYLYEFLPEHGSYKLLYNPECPCEIILLGYSTIPSVEVKVPNQPSTVYLIVDHELVLLKRFPEPLALPYFSHGLVKSKDGTRVPYTIVSAVKNPRKLLVEGYGAYGISARRSYPMRWLQWLQEGYAVARAMPRGGREDGDAWYDGGRTALRKQNTFDDTAAVIKMAQATCRIKPKKTVFYGRSAGGFLAANIAQQFPDLVGAVYAEVPYLDVLRTTTNPDLPLTQLEYDEFGDPAKRPQEYVALQRISPVDTVPLAKKDAPLIIVKTAVNDTQVLPYEALKWSKKLRANGWTVYTGIDGAGGHFAAESAMYQQQAEDAVLIDSYLGTTAAPLSRTRRSPRSHASYKLMKARYKTLDISGSTMPFKLDIFAVEIFVKFAESGHLVGIPGFSELTRKFENIFGIFHRTVFCCGPPMERFSCV
jgi:protease II